MQTRTRLTLQFIRRHLHQTDAVIGRALGISRQRVHQLRQRHKIAKVHGTVQRKQRMLAQIRGLQPGLTAREVTRQLGISKSTALMYGKLAGYRFVHWRAARHFYWRQRLKRLPPLLTIAAVARKLGVSYSHASLLCHRHKYKVTIPGNNAQPPRVPIRSFERSPKHERWLASLKPGKV